MTCAECRDVLPELDPAGPNDAGDETLRAARVHISACTACAAECALAGRATRLLRSLPALSPSRGFDARVLAAFFAEHAAAVHAPARLPGWVRRVAFGYAAVWGVVGALLAVWVVAGGGAVQVAHALAARLGPLALHGAAATRAIVEFLASLIVTVHILGDVLRILRPAVAAVGHALVPSSVVGVGPVVVLSAAAAAVAAYISRIHRRSHHVHAMFWAA
jgi:hypothetical protein